MLLLRALLRVLFGAYLNGMLFLLKHFEAKTQTPARSWCRRIHGGGKFKYNLQQSGRGESDDEDDDD